MKIMIIKIMKDKRREAMMVGGGGREGGSLEALPQ